MKDAPEGGSESEKVHRDAKGNDAGGRNGEEKLWTSEHRGQPTEGCLNRP